MDEDGYIYTAVAVVLFSIVTLKICYRDSTQQSALHPIIPLLSYIDSKARKISGVTTREGNQTEDHITMGITSLETTTKKKSTSSSSISLSHPTFPISSSLLLLPLLERTEPTPMPTEVLTSAILYSSFAPWLLRQHTWVSLLSPSSSSSSSPTFTTHKNSERARVWEALCFGGYPLSTDSVVVEAIAREIAIARTENWSPTTPRPSSVTTTITTTTTTSVAPSTARLGAYLASSSSSSFSTKPKSFSPYLLSEHDPALHASIQVDVQRAKYRQHVSIDILGALLHMWARRNPHLRYIQALSLISALFIAVFVPSTTVAMSGTKSHTVVKIDELKRKETKETGSGTVPSSTTTATSKSNNTENDNAEKQQVLAEQQHKLHINRCIARALLCFETVTTRFLGGLLAPATTTTNTLPTTTVAQSSQVASSSSSSSLPSTVLRDAEICRLTGVVEILAFVDPQVLCTLTDIGVAEPELWAIGFISTLCTANASLEDAIAIMDATLVCSSPLPHLEEESRGGEDEKEEQSKPSLVRDTMKTAIPKLTVHDWRFPLFLSVALLLESREEILQAKDTIDGLRIIQRVKDGLVAVRKKKGKDMYEQQQQQRQEEEAETTTETVNWQSAIRVAVDLWSWCPSTLGTGVSPLPVSTVSSFSPSSSTTSIITHQQQVLAMRPTHSPIISTKKQVRGNNNHSKPRQTTQQAAATAADITSSSSSSSSTSSSSHSASNITTTHTTTTQRHPTMSSFSSMGSFSGIVSGSIADEEAFDFMANAVGGNEVFAVAGEGGRGSVADVQDRPARYNDDDDDDNDNDNENDNENDNQATSTISPFAKSTFRKEMNRIGRLLQQASLCVAEVGVRVQTTDISTLPSEGNRHHQKQQKEEERKSSSSSSLSERLLQYDMLSSISSLSSSAPSNTTQSKLRYLLPVVELGDLVRLCIDPLSLVLGVTPTTTTSATTTTTAPKNTAGILMVNVTPLSSTYTQRHHKLWETSLLASLTTACEAVVSRMTGYDSNDTRLLVKRSILSSKHHIQFAQLPLNELFSSLKKEEGEQESDGATISSSKTKKKKNLTQHHQKRKNIINEDMNASHHVALTERMPLPIEETWSDVYRGDNHEERRRRRGGGGRGDKDDDDDRAHHFFTRFLSATQQKDGLFSVQRNDTQQQQQQQVKRSVAFTHVIRTTQRTRQVLQTVYENRGTLICLYCDTEKKKKGMTMKKDDGDGDGDGKWKSEREDDEGGTEEEDEEEDGEEQAILLYQHVKLLRDILWRSGVPGVVAL